MREVVYLKFSYLTGKSLRFSQNVVRKIARKHRLKDGSLKAQRNGGDKFPIPGHEY